MILTKPYDFRNLQLHGLDTIINAINRYIVVDYAHFNIPSPVRAFHNPLTGADLKPVFLYGLTSSEKDVPPFNHPVIDENHNWIAMDLRTLVTPEKEFGTGFTIKNDSEYFLSIQRFILTAMWYTGKQSAIYGLKLPHYAYSNWLSENITRKFGLDPANQMQIKALALAYYANLFTNHYDDDDKLKLNIRTKEDVIAPSILEEILSDVGELNTIDDFCRECYTVTKNIRVKDLDYPVLVNVLAGNWMGANGKELSILSIEHPPTWISLVATSLTQKSFKKNFIATVVDKLDKRGRGDEFMREYNVLTKEYKQE